MKIEQIEFKTSCYAFSNFTIYKIFSHIFQDQWKMPLNIFEMKKKATKGNIFKLWDIIFLLKFAKQRKNFDH